MSEQYPLLYEELSEEEKFSPRFQRRRPTSLRGRAKYHVKGAAAIMTRWPEHWTSILTYWWIGLGMIALTSFIIYNTIFSIALIQPMNTMPTNYVSYKTITHTTKSTSPPNVFMHVFLNDKEKGDLKKYLPYIEVFAKKYKDFTYNLIIVANDTNIETSNVSDETNNDIALNLLWSNNDNYESIVPINSNIKIKYIALSNYLNQSPIKKHWTNLPHQFIQFLVRAISVWDQGGIAINPDILTPQTPHAAYLEKFVSIIENFKKSPAKIISEQKQEMPMRKHNKISPRLNNIRDIINALETEDVFDSSEKEILHAVESQTKVVESKNKNKLKPLEEHETQTNSLSIKEQRPGEFYDSNIITITTDQSAKTEEVKSDSSSNLLPSFMDYLFHNKKTKKSYDVTRSMKKRRSTKINDETENNDLQMRNFWNSIITPDNYKPMIVSAKGILNNTAASNTTVTHHQDNEKLFELTVDLKGNIIATETPCHAFIGTVFTNSIHHDVSESLKDFIIKELSIFCKGLLASCLGIDVILV